MTGGSGDEGESLGDGGGVGGDGGGGDDGGGGAGRVVSIAFNPCRTFADCKGDRVVSLVPQLPLLPPPVYYCTYSGFERGTFTLTYSRKPKIFLP